MKNAIKEKARKSVDNFIDFLKNIFMLFRYNFGEISFFVFSCAIITLSLTALAKSIFLNSVMFFNGVTYIAPNNLLSIIRSIPTILLFIIFQIIVTFFALFEIGGLLHAFSMSQIGRNTNIASMCYFGYNACKRALHPKNWLIIVFVIVLLPLTKVLPVSTSTFKVILPGFVSQTIDYTQSYTIIYNVAYTLLLCGMVVYVFAIKIFVLEKTDFMESCNRSRALGKGNYFTTFFYLLILTVLLNFSINSISSIVVINIRELIAVISKGDAGIVSKSYDIGTYTYVLRQILKSISSPAILNAGLTVLFYKYMEERNLFNKISRDTFKEIESPHSFRFAIYAIVVFVLISNGIYLLNKYSFLSEPVDRPLVCAHRGDNVHAPENTMEAFELAAGENLQWIELDVHQTADGVVVCNHDANISRTTGINLNIHDCTFEELSKYEYLDSMPGDYEHVTMPTLKEALLFARENEVNVQVEIKGHKDDINFEENILKAINETGMHDNVMIIAQDYTRLKRINELDPTITKGYCMFLATGNLNDLEYTDNISIEESNVTPELVKKMHDAGVKVFCWTVDLEDTIQYLVSCDVDVIGTDNPLLISSALDKVNYSGGFLRAFYIILNNIANMDK